MEALLLTLAIWGIGAVFIGLFIAGVGIVPIALLATLIEDLRGPFIELLLLTILTFVSRISAKSLAESLEGGKNEAN